MAVSRPLLDNKLLYGSVGFAMNDPINQTLLYKFAALKDSMTVKRCTHHLLP
jgi:hypothetical protein